MFVLGVIAVVLAVLAVAVTLVSRSRLAAQRQLVAESAQRTVTAEGERDAATTELEVVRHERDAAAVRADEAEGRSIGVDAGVLWALELLRSERTWRHSVAPGPDSPSGLSDTAEPLREALQIELDAAREEVGVEVELSADLPAEITAAGSLLALRVAQELLAPAVRQGELTSVQLSADGTDLVIAVHALDQDDEPVALEPLAIPTSTDIEVNATGVRIRRTIRAG